MIKNILKSSCWGLLYIIASIVGVVIAFIAEVALNVNELIDISEEAMMDYVFELIAKITMPSLIIAAVICIFAFAIYRLIKRQGFDIANIDVSKATYFVSLGVVLNVVISLILSIIYLFIPETGATSELESVMELILGGESFWITLIGAGILVPIMEEIIFRYGIYKTLSRSNVIVAYIVSALLFGIAHGNLIQGTYATVLGLVFSYVYMKTDNVWYPIAIHMGINSSSTIATYIPNMLYFFVPVTIISVIILIVFYIKMPKIREMFAKTVNYTVSVADKTKTSLIEEEKYDSNQQ